MRKNFHLFAILIIFWLIFSSCSSLLINMPYSLKFDSGQGSYSLIFYSEDSSFEFSYVGGLANDKVLGTYSIKNRTVYLETKAPEAVRKSDNDVIELIFYDGLDKENLTGVIISLESGEEKMLTEDEMVLGKEQLLAFTCLGYKGSNPKFFNYGKWKIYFYPTFRNPAFSKWKIRGKSLKNRNIILKGTHP